MRQKRCRTTGLAEIEIQEDINVNGGDTGQQIWKHHICRSIDIEVCRGLRCHPAPLEQNMNDYG